VSELASTTLELIGSWLQLRDGSPSEPEDGRTGLVADRRAHVAKLEGDTATLEYEGGGVDALDVPERIGVRAAMAVRVLEYADGRVLYLWDQP
jgi:hypothetical protein